MIRNGLRRFHIGFVAFTVLGVIVASNASIVDEQLDAFRLFGLDDLDNALYIVLASDIGRKAGRDLAFLRLNDA
jgi:hypothetical protein